MTLAYSVEYFESKKKYFFWAWLFFLTAIASVPAYYRMFTEFSPWDDEGALIVTVKQFLGGTKLYNQISVPYGPIYYFYNWALRTLTTTPVTHDAVRMSSLIPWLLTALVSAWIIFRFTNSIALATAGHLLVFRNLHGYFHKEPGHPQELCIFVLVCIVASGIVASIPKTRLLGMILLGALPAALLLIKVNIGTFAFLAISLAVLAHAPKTWLSRVGFYSVGIACVLLPVILMKAQLRDPPTQQYAVLVTLSMLAVLLLLFRVPRTSSYSWRDCIVAGAAYLCSFVAAISVLKMLGISLVRTVHALLLDSIGSYVVRGSFYIPLPLGRRWSWVLIGPLLCVFFARGSAKNDRTKQGIAYLKLALFILTLIASGPLRPNILPPLFELVIPFSWLILYPIPDSHADLTDFARTLLCVLSVLQTLYVYPVAGDQVEFVEVLPYLVVLLCLYDFAIWLRRSAQSMPRRFVQVGALTVLFFGLGCYVVMGVQERHRYYSMPSLRLPGSTRIHLPEAQARDYRWLVQQLKAHCDVFIGLPELPSLHVWTTSEPLDGMDMDDWMLVTSNEQQTAAAAALSKHPDACMVYNGDLVAFWNRPPSNNLFSLPLVHYLHQNFKVVGATGAFSFLVRNQRNVELTASHSLPPF